MESFDDYALLKTREHYRKYQPVIKPITDSLNIRFFRILAERRHTFFMKVKACYIGRPCSAEDDVMWMESAEQLDEYYRKLWVAGKWCGLPESNWKSPTA